MQNRTQRILNHFTGLQPEKSPDDIVIVSAYRTPLCKSRRGGFKDTHPDDLLAAVLEANVKKNNLQFSDIQDVCVGNVGMPGAGALQARLGQFIAGFPDEVPVHCVNRMCSSGLQAFANVAGSIASGAIDVGIAAGVESMTQQGMNSGVPEHINPKIFDIDSARDCLTPMGDTSENVAAKYGITRETQDKFAFESHQKAAKAQASGRFADEIVPVKTILVDKEGNEKDVVISQDDGIRPETTIERLAKLKPVFKAEGGTTTAGNSSQTTDGAAACLVMKRSTAQARGLPILGVFRGYSVNGVPPAIMGIGPAAAIPEALKKAGVRQSEVDVFEINEAFASQATYCVEKLGIDPTKVNPNGGAIALGHPLGATGARQIATLLHELKKRGGGIGVVSMCIGTGMGAAGVFEVEK